MQPSCSECAATAPVWRADDGGTYCRRCWRTWYHVEPPISRIWLPTVQSHRSQVFASAKEVPWTGPWPQRLPEEPAKHSFVDTTKNIVPRALAAIKNGSSHTLHDLCESLAVAARRLHCEDFALIAHALIITPPAGTARTAAKHALRAFLTATQKHCQPCSSATWVARAGEIQVLGLAHGDSHVDLCIDEALKHGELYGDVCCFAELLWVFLTAKVPDARLFIAQEVLNVSSSNVPPDALAALVCALPQAPAATSKIIMRRLEAGLAPRVEELPDASLPRLAGALGEMDVFIEPLLGSVLRIALARGLASFSSEDLAEFAVAAGLATRVIDEADSSVSLVAQLLDAVEAEAAARLESGRGPVLLAPGARAVLRQGVGSIAVGTSGVLGEFILPTGCWRLWLDDGRPVDVRESQLELSDGGERPSQCCTECWRLVAELKQVADGSLFCAACLHSGVVEDSSSATTCLESTRCVVRGTRGDLEDEEDEPVSGREAARIACSRALAVLVDLARPQSQGLEPLVKLASRVRWRALQEKPFIGRTALSNRQVVDAAPAAAEVPVLCLNLDRSPHRLGDMAAQFRRAAVPGRRFPATDGRHRVVRRSTARPYQRDLPDFALRWDESRPASGVAMTAERQRHYIGYVGSWLSHMRALRHGFEEGFPFVVVLEDDQVLSPNFNSVVADIIECAGDTLDVVLLGPLDWRIRAQEYAVRRKVMQLRSPCSDAGSTDEENHLAELRGYQPELGVEKTHFLYSVGCKAMGGEDYMSTGCCGIWGYLVSRRGMQKMQQSMKFMWESADDCLQAEMQGDNRFTESVGVRRLWAVWPPIVTSDGKWPSQNSGEDLDMGRQAEAVSPHASFRDPSLRCGALANICLGPDLLLRRAGGVPTDGELELAAITALLWPPVEPIWAYAQASWRALMDQRNGSGGGFELRTQMQLRLHLDRRFFDVVSEGLTWSWTILRAAFLFGLHRLMPVAMNIEPPQGPPLQLLPLDVRIIAAPGLRLLACTDAWFRDLTTAAPDARVILSGTAAARGASGGQLLCNLVSELRPQLPRASFREVDAVSVAVQSSPEPRLPPGYRRLAMLADIEIVNPDLLLLIKAQLDCKASVVVTARQLWPLVEVLKALDASECLPAPRLVFAGANPFGSWLKEASDEDVEVTEDPSPGVWARLRRSPGGRLELEGRECFVASSCADGRWRVRVAGLDSTLEVPASSLLVPSPSPWPPRPPLGQEIEPEVFWRAVRNQQAGQPKRDPLLERLAVSRPEATNAFWIGLAPNV